MQGGITNRKLGDKFHAAIVSHDSKDLPSLVSPSFIGRFFSFVSAVKVP